MHLRPSATPRLLASEEVRWVEHGIGDGWVRRVVFVRRLGYTVSWTMVRRLRRMLQP